MALKYFLYARKSSESEDRQAASIDAQVDELRLLAEKENLTIVETLTESQSAKQAGREVFNKMVASLENGEADGLICWKLDRLARNGRDFGVIQDLLQNGIIKHIRTFERNYYPGDNVLAIYLEFAMANQFVLDLSVNTKRGLRRKASEGWYPTYPPLGYTFDPLAPKGQKMIIKDDKRFTIVQKMMLSVAAGKSPQVVHFNAINKLGLTNKRGGVPSLSTFYRLLNDPFYYGEFEYPKGSGNVYAGKHPAMITRDTFNEIRDMLRRRLSNEQNPQDFAFRGMIHCGECGALITAERKIKNQKNGNRHEYVYYHCTKKKMASKCSQPSVTDTELEKQLAKIVGTIEIPHEFVDWTLRYLKLENKEKALSRKKIIAHNQENLKSVLSKIDSLIDMRADKLITDEEFLNKKKLLLDEKSKFEQILNDQSKKVESWLEYSETIFDYAERAKKKLKSNNPQDKREVLEGLKAKVTLKDQQLIVTLPEILKLIKKKAKPARKKEYPEIQNLPAKERKQVLISTHWLPTPVQNFRQVPRGK